MCRSLLQDPEHVIAVDDAENALLIVKHDDLGAGVLGEEAEHFVLVRVILNLDDFAEVVANALFLVAQQEEVAGQLADEETILDDEDGGELARALLVTLDNPAHLAERRVMVNLDVVEAHHACSAARVELQEELNLLPDVSAELFKNTRAPARRERIQQIGHLVRVEVAEERDDLLLVEVMEDRALLLSRKGEEEESLLVDG